MGRIGFLALAAGLMASGAAVAQAVPCGGSFAAFKQGVAAEARAAGLPGGAIEAVLRAAQIDERVLRMDRSQGVFRQTFLQFSQRSVSAYRMQHGAANLSKYAEVFARAQREYGVQPEVIAAFWALETDFGAVQGDFNTVSALATLAHDCRRPELFRPQLLAAIALTAQGDLDPATTTGAWAGEIGQVQMLPEDILTKGRDGDGDGHVRLKASAADAILTAGNLLHSMGWRPNEPWLIEVTVPADFPWALSGLDATGQTVADFTRRGVKARNGNMPQAAMPARLLLPQGRLGPKFLAFPNYDVYLEWNQSFVYTVTAAYLATRLGGAQRYDAGNPGEGLNDDQMIALQRKLVARGWDVGGIDGVLGGQTRKAIQAEQQRLGMPPDGWPTAELLNSL